MNGNKLEVFIVTAGNCGACIGLKSRKIYDAIIQNLRNKGANIHEIYLKAMSDQYNSEGNYRNMDKVINSLYKKWFPMFISITRETFDAIEDGTLSSMEEVAEFSNVLNGIYIKDKKSFDIEDRQKGISEQIIYSWYDNVLINGKKFAKQAPPIAKPLISNKQLLPNAPQSSQSLTSIHRNGVIDIGDIPDSLPMVCPAKMDFQIRSRYGRG